MTDNYYPFLVHSYINLHKYFYTPLDIFKLWVSRQSEVYGKFGHFY